MAGKIQYGDEIEKYRVAQSIVDGGDFSFRPTALRNVVGSDGRTIADHTATLCRGWVMENIRHGLD
jgi:hypothetical protein